MKIHEINKMFLCLGSLLGCTIALVSCSPMRSGTSGVPQSVPFVCSPTPAGVTPLRITTFVGDGIQGSVGDGGPAVGAQLNFPNSTASDSAGNLYISDGANRRVRKVSPDGTISTVAGDGTYGFSGDGGPATRAQLSVPTGLVVDKTGNIYLADSYNNRIRKITPDGIIRTVAGNGTYGFSGDGGPATNAQLNVPMTLALDPSGNIYFADIGNYRIRRLGTDGSLTTFAGTGVAGFSGDGGLAISAQLSTASGLASDSIGNLYISDWSNHRIRKVAVGGTISTFVGDGTAGFSGDGGQALSARINYPGGLALDGSGNLFFTDTGNTRIRKIDSLGIVSTVAGDGSQGYAGDGGVATNARFDYAREIAISPCGDLYITDVGNFRIRRVELNNITARPEFFW